MLTLSDFDLILAKPCKSPLFNLSVLSHEYYDIINIVHILFFSMFYYDKLYNNRILEVLYDATKKHEINCQC